MDIIDKIASNVEFTADEVGVAVSTCMAAVRRGVLEVVGTTPLDIKLPDGRVITRDVKRYRKV